MSKINNYTSIYNTSADYTAYFSSILGTTENTGNSFSLSDYASIKNGSYGKLLKAYYAKQDADKSAKAGDSAQRSLLIRSSADALKKSADALTDDSLWEKKKIIKKDEKTGEETEIEDYDWDAITKAVEAFTENYNNMVEEAGKSDVKAVLRNAAWMTNMTSKAENLLAKIGITIGKGNKLKVDEEELKKSDISTLQTLFIGYGSFMDRVAQRAGNIGLAVGNSNETYTRRGNYTNALSELISGKVNEEV